MSLAISNTLPPRITLPDGAAALPPAARHKLRLLLDAADAARDLMNGTGQRTIAAQNAVRRLEERLEDQRTGGGQRIPLGGRAGALASRQTMADQEDAGSPRPGLAEELAEARAEYNRRSAISSAADEAAQPLLTLATRIAEYLRDNRGSSYQDVPPPVVKVAGTKFAVLLEQARRAVTELMAERDATRAAPPADGELRRGIEQAVADMAARGRPFLARGAEGLVEWPQHRAQVMTMGGGAGGATVPDAIAAAAWLNPELMTERLFAEAVEQRRATGQAPGLPRAARAEALARLGAQILVAERMEEATIVALEAAGYPVVRRPEADPRAVLGFNGPAPANI